MFFESLTNLKMAPEPHGGLLHGIFERLTKPGEIWYSSGAFIVSIRKDGK
jgi:hypothetical protein